MVCYIQFTLSFMRIFFDNVSIHNNIFNVTDDVYTFLSKFNCSAFKKHIYLADNGYYDIKDDVIYRNCFDFNETIQPPKIDSIMSIHSWIKTEVYCLPINCIKVDLTVERFKISDTMSFVIERNDSESVDWFIEVKGKIIKEADLISFLSEITNVCVN